MQILIMHPPGHMQVIAAINSENHYVMTVSDVIGGEGGAEDFPDVGAERAPGDPNRVVEGVGGIGLVPAVIGEELPIGTGKAIPPPASSSSPRS
jgi:hypothetical protein